jgi:hypothetical protein
MGMYCCCDRRITREEFECLCAWEGWISTCDWPEERKNKDISVGLPTKDGKYLVRVQNGSGDRYEEEKHFSLVPRIEKRGYFGPPREYEIHWEGQSWEEGAPYAWKEIKESPNENSP